MAGVGLGNNDPLQAGLSTLSHHQRVLERSEEPISNVTGTRSVHFGLAGGLVGVIALLPQPVGPSEQIMYVST
jgi:hypothetical protein